MRCSFLFFSVTPLLLELSYELLIDTEVEIIETLVAGLPLVCYI